MQGPKAFSVQHNDSYAFRRYPELSLSEKIHQFLVPTMRGAPRTGTRRCAACGELLFKWNEPLDGLRLAKRHFDLSVTYDGVTVISKRFKEFYEKNRFTGLEFRQLPDDPGFCAIMPNRTVAFNAEQRGTRFLRQCAACGRFGDVVGATPIALKPSRIDPREFVRTDLEFGSDDEKSPLLICGGEAADLLARSGLKGIDFHPVTIPSSGAEEVE